MNTKTLLYHKPIPLHYALRLLNPLRFSFQKFGACPLLFVVKSPSGKPAEPPLWEVIDSIVRDCVETLVHQFARAEREELRARRKAQKKKGNWGLVKRAVPLYHAIYDQARGTTFPEYFQVVLAVVRELPLPWPSSPQGRPSKYDRHKLLAPILIKHLGPWSYRALVTQLAQAGLDLRQIPRGPLEFPHYSYLAKLPEGARLSEAYLAQAVEHLEAKVYSLYCRSFGGSKDHWFTTDSTADPCGQYQVRERAMKKFLRRETITYSLACRLVTNTIVTMEFPQTGVKSRCDLQDSLEPLPEGATVLADREYDVEYNHQQAKKRQVDFHCPSKRYRGKPFRGWYRRQTRLRFDPKKYRWRKLGERPFGNFVTRGVDQNRYRLEATRRRGVWLNAFAHNLLAYFMELWWGRSFLPLSEVI